MLTFRRLICLLLALGLLTISAVAEMPNPTLDPNANPYDETHPELLEADQLYCTSAILIEQSTGEVIFEKNADLTMYPASTTKIMTVLLGILNSNPDDKVTVSYNGSAAAMRAIDSEATVISLQEGEELTMQDLLFGTLIRSGNDGAVAIAEAVAGNESTFVPLMNQTSASDNSLVKLRFHHTLTRIAIYVKSDDNTTGKQITAFSIRGMKNGILTCHIPEDSKDKGFGWSYPAPAETETFTATATRFDIPDNTATPKELLATFYLLPYGTESVFNLTYTYQAYNSDNTDITQTIILSNQTLPSTEMWTEGASISYTLGISRKKVTVTAGSLPTWNTGSTETVSETVVIN